MVAVIGIVGIVCGLVGVVLGSALAARSNSRQQLTDAKRAAYSHLIGAIRTYVLTDTVKRRNVDQRETPRLAERNADAILQLHFALGVVELVSPNNVRDMVDTMQGKLAANPPDTPQDEWDALIDAMRADIGAKD